MTCLLIALGIMTIIMWWPAIRGDKPEMRAHDLEEAILYSCEMSAEQKSRVIAAIAAHPSNQTYR
jgi:hypothetical protein